MSLRANRIQQLIKKKFYYGVFSWNGKEIIGNHKPLITKEVYDKANKVGKGVHEQIKTIENNPREHRKYHLKGFVKDNSGILLCSYTKKGQIYYLNQPRSNEIININENIIFEKFGELLKNYEVENDILNNIDRDIIIELLKQQELKSIDDKIDTKQEINNLVKKQENLLDMRLNEKISEELYLMKNNKIENDILLLKQEKNEVKKDDFDEKIKILFELAGSHYRSYKMVDNEIKAQLLKNYLFELFINNKKELTYEETPLF